LPASASLKKIAETYFASRREKTEDPTTMEKTRTGTCHHFIIAHFEAQFGNFPARQMKKIN
jgi:hypothetical protein